VSDDSDRKAAERRLVELVFGGESHAFEPAEQPDFLLDRDGQAAHGVEVTRFYLSETDARMREIPGYGVEILRGEGYRHKADPQLLTVEEITFHQGPEDLGKRLRAVRRDIPSEKERLERLAEQIGAKNSKIDEYQKKVATVDLIVDDTCSALRIRDFGRFLGLLSDNQAGKEVASGGFREVYLIADTEDVKVFVPLKANLLALHVITAQNCWGASKNPELPAQGIDCLKAIVWRLSQHGLGDALVRVESERIAFRYGSLDLAYCQQGTQFTRRALPEPTQPGWRTSTALVAKFDDEDRDLARAALGDTSKFWCAPLLHEVGTGKLVRVSE